MIISDALATQLLNVAPDPTVIVDGNGTIIYANARVPDVLGYTPEEIIGKPVEVLLPLSAREGHPKHRSSFFEKPRARAWEAHWSCTPCARTARKYRWRSV